MFGFTLNKKPGFDASQYTTPAYDPTKFASVATPAPVQKQVSAPVVPQQAMQSYASPIEDEDEEFKGLSKADVQRMNEYTKGDKYKTMELYPSVLQNKQDEAFLKDRKKMLAQAQRAATQGDGSTKEHTNAMVKVSTFSDFIRETEMKKGAVGVSKVSDDEILAKTLKGSAVGEEKAREYFGQYMGGKMSVDQLHSVLMTGEFPKVESNASTLQNIGEGMYRYAAGIPGAIAESGLLDKPLEAIVQGVSNITGLEVKNDKTFSEFSQESATGGDPNSAVAKGVETGLNVAEAVAGVGAAATGIAKSVAKKAAAKKVAGVADLIAEPETKKAVQKAIQQGRLEESTAGTVKRILFGDKGANIAPTKQIQEATDLVIKNIKKPASTPAKLYEQIGAVVNRRSDDLGSQLKQVELPSSVKSKKALKPLKDSVQELTTLTDEFTNTDRKKIGGVLKKLDDVTNLDDVRSLRKEWDTYFSDAVKQADDKAAPSTRKAQKLWKTTRSLLNDYLDTAAEATTDVAVKQRFKEMSALFKAQENILGSTSANVLKPSAGYINKKTVIGTIGGVAGAGFLNKIANQ